MEEILHILLHAMMTNDSKERKTMDPGLLKDKKIFCVDDSKVSLLAIRRILVQYGCEVSTETSPVRAIKKLEEEEHDCILTDYEMPEMTGADLCEKIKAHPDIKHTPVIILTSNEKSSTLINAIHKGADDYIVKSNVEEVIVAKIISMLRLKNINKEMVKLKQLEAIQSMIVTYHHHFNNALAIMGGAIHLLQVDGNPETHRKLKMINTAFDRMNDILAKIKGMGNYEVTDYADGDRMVDIENSDKNKKPAV